MSVARFCPAPALTHDQLASSLARALQGPRTGCRVTFENIELRKRAECWYDVCRPDVLAIVPTLRAERANPWVFEVKVSRGDFLSELKSQKYKHHARYASKTFFAAPKGLIKIEELPTGIGLWEYEAAQGTWYQTRYAKYNKNWSMDSRDLMKLILGRWGTRQGLINGKRTGI